MNWKLWLGIIVISLVMFLFVQWPDGKLHIVFCDVGEGDAALIIKGKFQTVIDTGPSIEKFEDCYSQYVPFWDREIEVLYISHMHKDHSGAMTELMKRYTVKKQMLITGSNDVLRYGSLVIDTLYGNEANDTKVLGANTTNDSSVILKMKYREFSTLFTSDIDEKGELALMDMGVLSKVNVLKVAHHGSKYGSTEKFLEKVKPETAVVSVGAKNSYGHPNGDTLLRLDAVGAKIFRTDKMGSIEVVTDGREYKVRHK